MAAFDVVIKDGTVVDGLRNARFRGDIGILDGRIVEIGNLRPSDGRRVLDARGLIVAPGFIDLHTHYDAQVFWDPYLTMSGWHGATTVVIGNCGYGLAPVRAEHRERAMLSLSRAEAIPVACMREGLPWDWETIPEFLDSVDAAEKALNVSALISLSPLLMWVMGVDRAKSGELPTDAEHAEMQRLVDEAMRAGASGMSTHRHHDLGGQRDYDGTPQPTDVMNDETMLALAEAWAAHNTGFMQYTQAFGTDRPFIERIASIARRPILWNALGNGPDVADIMAWGRRCRDQGLPVYVQGGTAFPSEHSYGALFSVELGFTGWDGTKAWREALFGPTVAERLANLADASVREAMKQELPRIPHIPGVCVVKGATPEVQALEGCTLGEVADRQGKDVVDVFCDVALADAGRTELGMFRPSRKGLSALQQVIADEYVVAGTSDGGAHQQYTAGGVYTTSFLSGFVRDVAWVTLEDAHWRLSQLPAHIVGLNDRGALAEGNAADIVVYDLDALDTLPCEVVHDRPAGEWRRVSRARGYRYLLVNGEVVVEDDKETGVGSGRLLRSRTSQRV